MLELLDSLVDEPRFLPGNYTLVRVSRRAMATQFEIAIPHGSHPNAVAAAEDALELIDDLEDQMTVFRDHSEVSRLNAAAAAGPVPVEPHLFELFQRCAAWTLETAGAFDIATGALTKAWGFFRREGQVPSPRERNAAMARTGMKHVILDRRDAANPQAGCATPGFPTIALFENSIVAQAGCATPGFPTIALFEDSIVAQPACGFASGTVKFRVPGLEFNLGAVGKGYALDRAAELLRLKWGVRSALLHGGSSSVLAIGQPPGDSRGWPIRLCHPDGRGSLGTVHLRDRGLGTSSATFQFFEYNGRKLGHLLDPRTGWPAEGTASATVTAPTAAEADAMSTACFVLGTAGAERLTRTRPHLGAVMLQDPHEPAPQAFNLAPNSFTPD